MEQTTETLAYKICIFFYLLFCIPLIVIVTKDIRLISAFNIDALAHLGAVQRMVNGPYRDPNLYYYGDAYFYLAAFIGLIYKVFHPVGDRELILIIRSVNLVFGILTIDALWRLIRKYFSPFVVICTLSFFVTNYWILYWSVRSHPDIMQLYFLVMGVYYACKLVEDASKRNVVISSLFAGLAFGTKYGGIFLLPSILFAYLLFHLKRPDFKWSFLKGKEFRKSFFLSAAIFTLSFLFTSPYRLVHPSLFLYYVNYQRLHNKIGHWFIASKNKLLWFPLILGEDFLGRVLFVLFFAYLIFVSVRLLGDRSRFRKNIHPSYVPLFWTLSLLAYTVWEINLRWIYYLIPILPFMILYAAVCLEKIHLYVKERFSSSPWPKIFMAGIFSAVLIPRIVLGYRLFVKEYNKLETPTAQAGFWLEKNFAAPTRIFYDNFAYIPLKFNQVRSSWGLKQKDVNSFKPDLVVTHQKLTSRYDVESKADLSWDWGKEHYLDCFYFYRDLAAGKNSSFTLIKDFGEVKVYANRFSSRFSR